jgi:hypothetical protein
MLASTIYLPNMYLAPYEMNSLFKPTCMWERQQAVVAIKNPKFKTTPKKNTNYVLEICCKCIMIISVYSTQGLNKG